MASVRDAQLINSLWIVYFSVLVNKYFQGMHLRGHMIALSLSGLLVLISSEAALVLSAELGPYESIAFLIALLFYILQSDVVDVMPQYPKDVQTETETNSQTETETESQMETEQILRSSMSSLVAIYCLVCAMMIVLSIKGLSILNPPDELTQEVLNMDMWSRKLTLDGVLGKIFTLIIMSAPRLKFNSRRAQLAIMVIHVSLLSAIWYGWSTSPAPNSFTYGIFLAIEVWDGRHLLYWLSVVSVVLQHSLTRR